MERHIFSKLESPGGHLEAKDLTADEKRALYALMGKYGLPESTTYNRFFDKGFDSWEMMGVDQCKADFVDSIEDVALCNVLYKTDEGFETVRQKLDDLKKTADEIADDIAAMAEKRAGEQA